MQQPVLSARNRELNLNYLPKNDPNKFNGPMTTRGPQRMSLMDFIKFTSDAEKLIVKPQVKSVSILDPELSTTQETSSILANDFIRNFVTEKNENVQAIIIQRAFRLYLTKKHYKIFLGLRIKYHRRLEKLCFSAWKLGTMGNAITLRSTYDSLVPFLPEVDFITQGREVAPFRLVYTTKQIFIPIGYTSKQILEFMRIMNSVFNKRMFKLWHLTARRMVIHRTSLDFIKYSTLKMVKFGFIYEIFKDWQKFVNYKKIERTTKTYQMPEIIQEDHDPSPYWIAIEKRLNAKRQIQLKADLHYRKTVAKKASNIILNNAKRNIFLRKCHSQSIYIDNKFRFKTAIRAWRDFDQKEQQKRKMLHDILQSWYKLSYRKAYINNIIDFYKEREVRFFSQKILNRWCFVARRRKIKDLKNLLSIQKKPSLCLQFAFFLSQRFEFGYHAMCFRAWLNLSRKRRAWARFKEFDTKLTPDAELAYGALMELRSPDSGEEILPNGLGVSLELTLRAKEDAWDGITTTVGNMRSLPSDPSVDRRSNLLVRSLLLYLHSKEQYDVFAPQKEAPFERYRTEEELVEQINANSQQFAVVFRRRIVRDMVLLTALDAHEAALNYTKIDPNHDTAPEAQVTIIHDYPKTPDHLDTKIYDEYEISVDALVRVLDRAPPRLVSTLKKERDEHFELFNNRLRKPSQIVHEPIQGLRNNPRNSKLQQQNDFVSHHQQEENMQEYNSKPLSHQEHTEEHMNIDNNFEHTETIDETQLNQEKAESDQYDNQQIKNIIPDSIDNELQNSSENVIDIDTNLEQNIDETKQKNNQQIDQQVIEDNNSSSEEEGSEENQTEKQQETNELTNEKEYPNEHIKEEEDDDDKHDKNAEEEEPQEEDHNDNSDEENDEQHKGEEEIVEKQDKYINSQSDNENDHIHQEEDNDESEDQNNETESVESNDEKQNTDDNDGNENSHETDENIGNEKEHNDDNFENSQNQSEEKENEEINGTNINEPEQPSSSRAPRFNH